MATMAASCGSAVVASAPASAGPRLSSSSSPSRTLHLARFVKVNISLSGPTRFGLLPLRATTSTEEATTTTSVTDTTATPTTEISTDTTTITEASIDTTSTSATETSLQADELIADLKAKWDRIENKTNVFVYGGGAVFALWLSATIVGAVNSVPLLPKVFELVGFGYSGWFVYRYLLFKESRKELVSDFEDLRSKITGAGSE